jgi:hypothetical protein
VAIGVSPVKPDVAITNGAAHPTSSHQSIASSTREPDVEVAVATLEEDASVQIEKDGRLIAALELVSPRNKDRPSAREQYAARYLNYLRGGVHLVLVDVHRRPLDFSFAKLIAASLGLTVPAENAPAVVSYRVGAAAAQGGRMLGLWQHALTIDAPLPAMALALTASDSITIDLETTYSQAAADCYITP